MTQIDLTKPIAASQEKPLPKWAQQLFDARNPQVHNPHEEEGGLRRSKRIEEQRRPSEHIANMALMTEIVGSVKEPASVDEAMAHPKWKEVMQSEYDMVVSRGRERYG
ncbi:hypothetical protein GOP47_0000852 [Adiantum capillus-veneris]|uniref:Uncharacterized protein n=1 Tax=Adiantum capillus-veneris TaxID=13818 RepID=A0A9D4ZR38_ADICA|nr:hypothetical protein GOP47_0000852 [Adiantum capillus-veneris]